MKLTCITATYNDGLSGARNKALEQVKGDYVCFLDADDIRPNWSFKAIANTIDNDAPDLIFCKGVLHDVRADPSKFFDDAVFSRIQILSKSPGRFPRMKSIPRFTIIWRYTSVGSLFFK